MEIVSSASDGDLTARGEVSPDELGSVTDAFNHMLESIGGLVVQTRRAALDVNRSAEAILEAARHMAEDAAAQAHALDVVSKKIKALGGKYERIKNIVQEDSVPWTDDHLKIVMPEDLFGFSAEKIGELIVNGS